MLSESGCTPHTSPEPEVQRHVPAAAPRGSQALSQPLPGHEAGRSLVRTAHWQQALLAGRRLGGPKGGCLPRNGTRPPVRGGAEVGGKSGEESPTPKGAW